MPKPKRLSKRSWKKTLINNLTSRSRNSFQEHLEEHHRDETGQVSQTSQTSHSEDSFQEYLHENNQVSARPTRASKARCLQNLTKITQAERSYDLAVSRERAAQRVANEDNEQRERRLQYLRQRSAQRLANENDEQRERRLEYLRQRAAQRVAANKNQLALPTLHTDIQEEPTYLIDPLREEFINVEGGIILKEEPEDDIDSEVELEVKEEVEEEEFSKQEKLRRHKLFIVSQPAPVIEKEAIPDPLQEEINPTVAGSSSFKPSISVRDIRTLTHNVPTPLTQKLKLRKVSRAEVSRAMIKHKHLSKKSR